MTFKLAASPHSHQRRTTQQVMRWVYLALIPGVMTLIYFFGWGVIWQLLLAIATAWTAEALCMMLRGRPVESAWRDHTALVTAVLLAISIPGFAPWWIIVIGTAFSIIIVKHVYGGVGQNIFNPAMAGYVVLLISFPVQMTSWPLPVQLSQVDLSFLDSAVLIFTGYTPSGYDIEQLRMGADGMTMATPLDSLRTALNHQLTIDEALQQPIFGSFAGLGWQWVNAAFLLGGLVLLKVRVISWHIPVGMLLGLAVPAALAWLFSPDQSVSPVLHLFSGATMLGAFFIATDPVTAATSKRGRLYFGLLIGFLVFAIRTWGGYPDAVAFAVLLANMTVPIIDKYTQPVVYGHGGRT
ncbi:electron transport complex subunit RsxD [Pseudidiomarina terrestris]|uniref:Ion-translocating oxidoreductase complex subunit D n=1 Tax=Pseudidiomarina terrestris TaxID=2820060 RepID=A0AAW7QWL4_9GAMM|nr:MULTISPECIES: electron transport complex subunit RsxD [unclassified Pseudidiomarina]MDN7123473.1 electron transport complex subunit RsxD [Pseudidiomarina sp. 1APP75-32.1]MDN7126737.1 electron transport complex subunit RsxD [Pseudidiomarina sp. 1APR75-33.1]MDN7128802.1 electron transport complex subunit RsxD [Pseudidiomarina sp. 1APR75-15]MDN7134930.1 electron transport complex subunit RsxD [Pseudidiomarina sp. 1ASP75-5]MDN7137609.1 electron transport complex subunit RsxD [Pseudidiomarina sp